VLERLQIGYEHEKLMADRDLKRKEIENQRTALDQKAAEAKAKMQAQEKEMQGAQGKIDRKEAKLFKRYISVMDTFGEQIEEATWGESDWEPSVKKASSLSEDIITYVENVLDEDTDELIAIENLRVMGELVQGFIDNHGIFSGSVVDTELDEEDSEAYEELLEVEAINDEFEV
jgi:seryl-tRNA synthetase